MGRKKQKWEWENEKWNLNSRKGWLVLYFPKQSYAGNCIQESFPFLDQGDLCNFIFIQSKRRPNFQDPFNGEIVPTPPPPPIKIYKDFFNPCVWFFWKETSQFCVGHEREKITGHVFCSESEGNFWQFRLGPGQLLGKRWIQGRGVCREPFGVRGVQLTDNTQTEALHFTMLLLIYRFSWVVAWWMEGCCRFL